MRKILVSLLAAVLMLTGLVFAEETAQEPTASEVFNELAYLYDCTLNYMEQFAVTWEATMTAQPDDVNEAWFDRSMLLLGSDDIERCINVYDFAMTNHFRLEASNTQCIYTDLFLPLYETCGKTADGLQEACFRFTNLVFWDDHLPARLETQKANIKRLMETDPDYAYLENLKEFYKKTSMMLDYVAEFSGSYVTFTQDVKAFKQTRREIKSDFEFEFDWPDYVYEAPILSADYEVFFRENGSLKPTEEEMAAVYQQALTCENNGAYQEAAELYRSISDYQDSADREKVCMYQQALIYEDSGDLESAFGLYCLIPDYQDSADRGEACKAIFLDSCRLVRKKTTVCSGDTVISEWSDGYTYDEQGHFKGMERLDGEGNSVCTMEYTTDETGKIVSSIRKGDMSTDTTVITYDELNTYDEHENIVKTETTYHTSNDQSKYEDGMVVTIEYQYEYDEKGNITRETEYQWDAVVLDDTYEYVYREDGTPQSATLTSGSSTVDIQYVYNAFGLPWLETRQANGIGTTVEYNYSDAWN